MRKIITLLLSTALMLTGCIYINKKEEPLDYEKQLEFLKGEYIKYTGDYVDGWESLSISPYGGGKVTTDYFNYEERKFYTVIDGDGTLTNELVYNDNYYRIYSDNEPEIDYNLSDPDRGTWSRYNVFDNIERLLTFLAMLDAFGQDKKVVVYNEKSSNWEELANYYTLTMRENERTSSYKDSTCRASKITVTKKSDDTVVVTVDEVDCEDDDGTQYSEINEIEVTIGYSKEDFMDEYDYLVESIDSYE